ncbi:proton-conducting transporter membrane subunit [Caldilinea sp.]|uniref:NADH-quinone oxidoreductase subunit 5 family protein n=1 Tax=Caldilinea sp. TaxID=2293560 RepID=UPI002C60052E|nr:proton-conducting transporter membrane subunit [Caldilinea sp.]HRA65343.1 proton-conducting transporter membrane subunit [Caldilinea sp.]
MSALTAIGGVAVSFILGWPIAFAVFTTPHFGAHPLYGELFTIPTGASELMIGFQVDPANALMIFMVTFLLLMIFIYSYGYMSFPPHLRQEDYPDAYTQGRDPRYSRFMAYISLFATGMLGLVVSNSLLTFFVFWEIMGLCSYLLIGFWFEKESAKKAAFKAFITTRIGDTIMFAGMMLLYMWSIDNTLVFEHILAPANLEHLAAMTVHVPILNFSTPAVALIAVLLFFGTIGKSAQFPLHVWLPDAMEGPTPVSALIHAATMVSAGVFLVVRMFPLFFVAGEVAPGSMAFVAGIGAFTALFASLIAVAQWDIKRVLAYSTIAQLGFMIAALGTGAYVAGLFHLITHAFFKALLFLGSGSVIHGVEHGFHHAHAHGDAHGDSHSAHTSHTIVRKDGNLDPHDPQDMRNMGGLLKRMPITGWTFIIGGMALSGFPLVTAGFWSKDEILSSEWYTRDMTIFWVLAFAALLTAFYTARQITLTFLGQPRSEGAVHAPESVKAMTIPLVLISPFVIVLGWFGIPIDFPVLGSLFPNWIEHQLEPYIEHLHFEFPHPEFNLFVLLISFAVSLGGLALGWFVYRKGLPEGEIDPLRRWLGPVWWAMHRKFWVDEAYGYTVVAFTRGLAKFMYWVDDLWIIDPIINAIGRIGVWLAVMAASFDQYVIDGAVNAFAWMSDRAGGVLRNSQNGQVQVYLMVVVVSLTIWLLLYALPLILTLV